MSLEALRTDGRAFALALMLAVIGWLTLALPASAQGELRFPALTGRVVDEANLLEPAKEAEITAQLEQLQRDTSDQLVVVTVNSLQDREIEDFGYQLGRAWGIGQSETDNGVLLIVAPNERKVRIEVGYGLEPILTDALSAVIIHEQILPAFREGGYERGIQNGVNAIAEQLRLDPAEAQARAAAVKTPAAEPPYASLFTVGVIVLFIFLSFISAASRGRRYGRRSGAGEILLWTALNVLASSGGRGGGGSGGGGGFSGGGGSFGGGGASGGW